MKFLCASLLIAIVPFLALSQQATKSGSAEAKARIAAYRDRISSSKPAAKSGRPAGAAAYDVYPEPWRSIFAEDWTKEMKAVYIAIQDDKVRFSRAKTQAEAMKYANYVRVYSERLMLLERNDPPYFNQDAIKALIEMNK